MTMLIWETIKERRWPLIIYCGTSILLLLLYIALFPSLQSQSQQLIEVLKTMPENLLKALGSSASQLSNFTLEALLASKQFSMLFQVLAAILAFSIAGNDLAGEVENGTIEFLLSQPVSRMKLYFSRFISGTILMTVFVVASTIIVIPLAKLFNVDYQADIYYKLFVVAWLYSMAFYAFSYALSAIFSSKGKVYGISAAVLVAMYAAFLISALKESLGNLKYISFFHYFSADVMYGNPINRLGIIIFSVTIIVCVSLGALFFFRRDITT